MKPRAAMWVQTRLGLGHLSRAITLCGALAADGFEVMLLNGGPPFGALAAPPGVALVQLPPAFAPDLSSQDIFDADSKLVDDTWRTQRIASLKNVLDQARPDVFLTETYPLGRRLFSFELTPVLEWLRSQTPRPLIVSSVRDIVTRPEKLAKTNHMIATALQSYDLVLCHSDPRILTLHDTFSETVRLAEITHHTGYVTTIPGQPAPRRAGFLIVAGGGATGIGLFEAAVAAQRNWKGTSDQWTIVTGPRFSADSLAALRSQAPPGLTIEGAVEGVAARYSGAKLVVAQAGYNTVCEVLSRGARLSVVPYADKGETEQTLRATRFEELGLLTWTPEAGLTPAKLGQAMERALDKPAAAIDIDFGGGAASARILRQALQERRS